eukprot:Sdes_comp16058_c0_seq1m5263
MRASFVLLRNTKAEYIARLKALERPKIFFPNQHMVLVNAGKVLKDRQGNVSNKVVAFNVTKTMTCFDIQNYLKTIYNVETVFIRTLNRMGKTIVSRRLKGTFKRPDIKRAYVHLKDDTFVFPELFKEKTPEEIEKETKEAKKQTKSWFSWFSR